jgi:hypothetical protein
MVEMGSKSSRLAVISRSDHMPAGVAVGVRDLKRSHNRMIIIVAEAGYLALK